MVYVAGAPRKAVLWIIAAGLIVLVFSYQFVLKDYQKERIWSTYRQADLTAAQRAGPGFQLTRSLAMVAHGGLLGQGYQEGPMTQNGGLPEQHNDFIFAPVAEEFGFVGALFLLLLSAGLFYSLLRLAATTRDPEGRLLCVGVALFYGIQSTVEMAVTLGLAPTTGMPLPLVSYGGSSYLASIFAIALAQNVAVHRVLVQGNR
jgi:rod shape determining protein RodA